MIIPVAAFPGPVIGSNSPRGLIHPFFLSPAAEAMAVEIVGGKTWNA